MEYKTIENRYRPKTPHGSNLIPTYGEAIDKNGKTYLKKTGDINMYEKIQASLEETKIYNILEQFLQSGDETILKRREGIYGNFLDIPKSPIELQNTIMRAEKDFEALDKDVRAEFENDVGIFKQSILDGTFENRMEKYIKNKINKQSKQTQIQETKTQQQEQQNQGVNLNE